MHTCIHAHTRTHTRTHTYTHICTHTFLPTGTRKCAAEEGPVVYIGRPPVAPINDQNYPFNMSSKQGRPRKPKKKIKKSDVGLPSDFRYADE